MTFQQINLITFITFRLQRCTHSVSNNIFLISFFRHAAPKQSLFSDFFIFTLVIDLFLSRNHSFDQIDSFIFLLVLNVIMDCFFSGEANEDDQGDKHERNGDEIEDFVLRDWWREALVI